MVNAIDAQLGLVPFSGPDSEQQMKLLANQLRGKQQLGDFLSLSPTMGKFGQQMSKGATRSAEQVGTRRQQGLTRTRQAAQDKIATEQTEYIRTRNANQDTIKSEALEQARKGYSDIDNQTQNGISAMWGRNNTTGVYEMVPGTEGMKTTKKGGKTVWPVKIPGSDENAFWNSDTGMVTVPRLGSQEFNGLTDPMLLKSLNIAAGGAGAIAGAKEWAKGLSDEAVGEVSALREQTGALGMAGTQLQNIINSLDTGARSGKGWDYLPTLTDATAQLESAVSNLTLEALTQYKLTPVSDRDLTELRSAAKPNLYGENLRRWAVHKQESVKRMVEANNVVEDYIRQNGRIPYGKARKTLEAEIEQVLHGDDFDFSFKLGAEDKTSEAEAEAEAMIMLTPEGITQVEWDSFTPEQKAQLE